MQHVELFNYENLTLKTVENLFHLLGGRKIRHFCRFNVRSRESWKNEFSIQKFTSFSKCKGTIFIAYYRQLLSTK